MQMKTLITTVALGALLALPSGGLVFAGQPNQECAEDSSQAPGKSGSLLNTGSPFHEANDATGDPGGRAGQVYAGSQTVNSKNVHSVSQYDVACTKQLP
jgi:hypothetical protein